MHPTGILGAPQDLGKPYLTHSDRCVQGEQYKLLAKIGLNLGHVASKPGHVGKEAVCGAEVTKTVCEVPTERAVVEARVALVAEVVVVAVVPVAMVVVEVVVVRVEVVVMVVVVVVVEVVKVVVVVVVAVASVGVPELGRG